MSKRPAPRRRAFGSISTRMSGDGPSYRGRISCRVCQAEADTAWSIDCAVARQKGETLPTRPRVVHYGPSVHTWQEAAAWLADMEEQQRAYDRDAQSPDPAFARHQCAVKADRIVGDGGVTQADVEAWGLPLSHYAQRAMAAPSRSDLSAQRRRDLWAEEYTNGAGERLGIGQRFGDRPVRTITRADVREWLRLTCERPGRAGTLSASQVRQRWFALASAFRVALEDDAIDASPMAGIRPPSREKGRAVTGLHRAEQDHRWLPSESDMQSICAAMDDNAGARAAAALMFGAGLRAGEVTALLRRDLVRVGERRWTVSITKSESQGRGRLRSDGKTGVSGHGVRALPEWVGVLLEAHLAEHPDMGGGDRLFPAARRGRGGAAVASLSHTAIRKCLARACARTRIERVPSLQDLRAAGEAHVAGLVGRPAAAAWARHGLGVQMAHYVAVETARASEAAAGW